ncbi:MAG: dehydrogenase [Candidatus Dormibacteraeota bacterium]|nr:dehydrogenase [Candidatus Dormibacteraeota bacterium]
MAESGVRRMVGKLGRWSLLRQATTAGDRLGLAETARSGGSERLRARVEEADRVVKSVCPYCGVGCGQRVFVKDHQVIQIEGDPDSPISRGRLCPKGSASRSLVTSDRRLQRCLYRRPQGRAWESISLDRAMDMIADRVIETRRRTWEDRDEQGNVLNRTMGIAHLGGATLDNEENYLIKKLYMGLGIIQVENQARI